MSTSKQYKAKKPGNRYGHFIYDLYPHAEKLIDFLQNRCGVNNIPNKVQSCLSNWNIRLYNETMDFLCSTLIYIPVEHTIQIPNISSATNMKPLIEDFLRNKFSNGNYNRKDSVLTLSYYPIKGEYTGKNKFIPLLNIDSIVMCDGSDEINYLLTNKYCQILHQLIGDNIFYFLLNKSTIFVAVHNKSNQCYWQLTGAPSSQQMWAKYREKKNKKSKQKTLTNKTKWIKKSKRKTLTNTNTKTRTPQIQTAKKRHEILSHYIIKKYQKMQQKQNIIDNNTNNDINITQKPKTKSILGKRKSKPIYLAKHVNKYRRLNTDNTCISSQRNKKKNKMKSNIYIQMAKECNIEINKKPLIISS
eukprot:188939_1